VPGLDEAGARALLTEAASRRGALRHLDRHLAAFPGALASGSADAPEAVIALAGLLAAAGYPGIVVVTCLACGRPGELPHRSGEGRLCRNCHRQRRQEPCRRCGRTRPVHARTYGGPLCSTCSSASSRPGAAGPAARTVRWRPGARTAAPSASRATGRRNALAAGAAGSRSPTHSSPRARSAAAAAARRRGGAADAAWTAPSGCALRAPSRTSANAAPEGPRPSALPAVSKAGAIPATARPSAWSAAPGRRMSAGHAARPGPSWRGGRWDPFAAPAVGRSAAAPRTARAAASTRCSWPPAQTAAGPAVRAPATRPSSHAPPAAAPARPPGGGPATGAR
jgi:hypothetical protein